MNRKLLLLTLTTGVFCLPACTTQQVMQVALAKNPEQAIKGIAERRVNAYKYNPVLILSDLKKAKADFNRLMG
ncbi:MAG: DUF3393 domain-containing protein, partial [Pseudomonadota bacterium]